MIITQTNKYLKPLVAILVMYAAMFASFWILLSYKIIGMPFHRVSSQYEAYFSVITYLPIAAVGVVTLIIIRKTVSLKEWFSWNGFSIVFILGILVSLGYSLYNLRTTKYHLRGPLFWPPVIILSLLNAFAEEIFYRLALFNLLKGITRRELMSNLLQSVLYAVIHIPLGGWRLAFPALVYGLLMGFIAKKHGTILPVIICHLLIDIGAIGLPMLIIR